MRALGSMETALNLTDTFSPLNLVSVVRLNPGPDPAALRRALDVWQARRPELRVAIVQRGGQARFEPAGPAPIPLQIVTPQADDDWQRAAENELNTSLPVATGPLARCTYLYASEPGEPSDLILTLQHTIVDGGSALGLWRELLALAAGETPTSGHTPTGGDTLAAATAEALAPPTEQLFPARLRGWRRLPVVARYVATQMAGELGYQIRQRGKRQPPIHPAARNRLLARRLPAPATHALVRRCRAERASLHSALGAAMLLAVQRRLYAGQAADLRAITFGNLRGHLQPPVTATEPGCHIALLRYSARLAAAQPFWPLARHIQQQLDQMARRDERFAAQLLAPLLVASANRLQRLRLANTALTYLGAPDLNATFGALRVLDLHAFVSSHRLGPEYTATTHLVDGELLLDIVYLDADLEAAQAAGIADEMEGCLAAATSDRAA